ncbi:MAG: hypothetical protein ACRDI1_04675 [Actinomycetota bacterium]
MKRAGIGRTIALLGLLVMLLGAGCKRNFEVGSKELTEIEEKQRDRIGQIIESPEPKDASPSPVALGAEDNPAQQQQQQQQEEAQKQEFFDIALVNGHPYFDPAPPHQVRAGSIIRIANKDSNVRHFRSQDGTYDTGEMTPGQTVEINAEFQGDFQIEDPTAPFITGFLQVF